MRYAFFLSLKSQCRQLPAGKAPSKRLYTCNAQRLPTALGITLPALCRVRTFTEILVNLRISSFLSIITGWTQKSLRADIMEKRLARSSGIQF